MDFRLFKPPLGQVCYGICIVTSNRPAARIPVSPEAEVKEHMQRRVTELDDWVTC